MSVKNILFVCLGNICRSPSAEAVMRKLAKDREIALKIDSAGIIGYHAGEPADARMKTHAVKRGYILTSTSRQVVPGDFDSFDMIIGMDDQNIQDLIKIAPTNEAISKISKMTDYCANSDYSTIPDPYYGGADGFELVLDLLEDACGGLLDEIEI